MKVSNLKLRLIGVVIVQDNLAVQSIGFNKFLPIGKLSLVIENLNRFGIDEIIILDINPSRGKRKCSLFELKKAASFAQVPISIGGGLRNVETAKKLIQVCADKIIFNSALFDKCDVIEESARILGSQAVIASMDVKYDKKKNDYICYKDGGKKNSNITVLEMIKKADDLGVGEIFINSIDRDGKKNGYDIKLLEKVKSKNNTPIIFCGGVGSLEHLKVPKKIKISGLAVGNYFNFSEHSVVLAKRYLKDLNYPVRLETIYNYKNKKFDSLKSFLPPSESDLSVLKFKSIKKEKI